MGLLVLVRHGQSEWNARKVFSGQGNPELTEQGIEEARNTGQLLSSRAMRFDLAFTSCLNRAKSTLTIILEQMQLTHVPVVEDAQLNERDYGMLTGMTIEAARQKYGTEQVHHWRTSLHALPPGGETLEMTGTRAFKVFQEYILPELNSGKNVILAAHRNTIRGLTSKLCKLGQKQTEELQIGTAEPLFFQVWGADNIQRVK